MLFNEAKLRQSYSMQDLRDYVTFHSISIHIDAKEHLAIVTKDQSLIVTEVLEAKDQVTSDNLDISTLSIEPIEIISHEQFLRIIEHSDLRMEEEPFSINNSHNEPEPISSTNSVFQVSNKCTVGLKAKHTKGKLTLYSTSRPKFLRLSRIKIFRDQPAVNPLVRMDQIRIMVGLMAANDHHRQSSSLLWTAVRLLDIFLMYYKILSQDVIAVAVGCLINACQYRGLPVVQNFYGLVIDHCNRDLFKTLLHNIRLTSHRYMRHMDRSPVSMAIDYLRSMQASRLLQCTAAMLIEVAMIECSMAALPSSKLAAAAAGIVMKHSTMRDKVAYSDFCLYFNVRLNWIVRTAIKMKRVYRYWIKIADHSDPIYVRFSHPDMHVVAKRKLILNMLTPFRRPPSN